MHILDKSSLRVVVSSASSLSSVGFELGFQADFESVQDDQFENLVTLLSGIDVINELEEFLLGDSDALGILLD